MLNIWWNCKEFWKYLLNFFNLLCLYQTKWRFEDLKWIMIKQNEYWSAYLKLLKFTPVHSRWFVSCPVQPQSRHWDSVFLETISVAWNKCAGQLAAGGVALVWRYRVRSPMGPQYFIGSFLGSVFLCKSIKTRPNSMYAKHVSGWCQWCIYAYEACLWMMPVVCLYDRPVCG